MHRLALYHHFNLFEEISHGMKCRLPRSAGPMLLRTTSIVIRQLYKEVK